MTTMRGRRRLALLVHPRDILASRSKRNAVAQALHTRVLDLVQLRATESDGDEDVLSAGTALALLVKERAEQPSLSSSSTRLVVNHSSLEMALAIGASGWHLKERLVVGRPAREVRRDVESAKSNNVMVGCSVHSVEAALQASVCGFDYIQVGTMFSTASHPEKSHSSLLEGPNLLRRIRAVRDAGDSTAALWPPLIAVGGIYTKDHVAEVMEAGADGVAVIRGILADNNPDEAARSYRTWLDNWSSSQEISKHNG